MLVTTFVEIPGKKIMVNVDRIISWQPYGLSGPDLCIVVVDQVGTVTAHCTVDEFTALIARGLGDLEPERHPKVDGAQAPVPDEGVPSAWAKVSCVPISCAWALQHGKTEHQHWERISHQGNIERTVSDGREPTW
jgi:hypothetical protein